jgi:hypothetical protein
VSLTLYSGVDVGEVMDWYGMEVQFELGGGPKSERPIIGYKR